MKKIWICLCALWVCPALAAYKIPLNDVSFIDVGGYARLFSGKIEGYQYNQAMKSEGYIKPLFIVNNDISVGGKISGRYILDDRFPSNNRFKLHEVYASVQSKQFGQIRIGDTYNVAYLLHQGSVDVGLFDIDDSDMYLFFDTPQNFYAPMLTYISTDSRDFKVNYLSPKINGIQWGVSVVQSEDEKPGTCADNGIKMDHGKGVIGSVAYQRSISGVDIGVSAGYAYYHQNRFFGFDDSFEDGNHHEYGFSVQAQKNNIRMAFSYLKWDYQDKFNISNVYAWTGGVAYDKGDYGVSLSYMRSYAKYKQKNAYEHIMLSAKYQLNRFVKSVFSAGRLTFDTNTNPSQNGYFGIAGLEFKI